MMDKNIIKNKIKSTFISEETIPGISIKKKIDSENKKANNKGIADIGKDVTDYEKNPKKVDTKTMATNKFNYSSDDEEKYHEEMEIMNGQEMVQYDRQPDSNFKKRALEAIEGSSNMGNNPEWANVVAKGQGGDPEFGKNLVKKIKASEKKRSSSTPTTKMFGDDWEVIDDKTHKSYAFESVLPSKSITENYDEEYAEESSPLIRTIIKTVKRFGPKETAIRILNFYLFRNYGIEKDSYINLDSYKIGIESIETDLKYDNYRGAIENIKSVVNDVIGELKYPLNEGKGSGINKKYTHFAYNKITKKIVNGWDYRGIDSEELRAAPKEYFYMDLNKKDIVIYTTKRIIKMGIDPFDIKNWGFGDDSLEKEMVKEHYDGGPEDLNILAKSSENLRNSPETLNIATKASNTSKNLDDAIALAINIAKSNGINDSEHITQIIDVTTTMFKQNTMKGLDNSEDVDRQVKYGINPIDENNKKQKTKRTIKEGLSEKHIRQLENKIEEKGLRGTAMYLVDLCLRAKVGITASDMGDTAIYANGLDEIESLLGDRSFDSAIYMAKDTAIEMLEDEGLDMGMDENIHNTAQMGGVTKSKGTAGYINNTSKMDKEYSDSIGKPKELMNGSDMDKNKTQINNKKQIKETMKRLKFKKEFNGIGNAIKLIPESYKIDRKVFEMTDGNENYKIRWEGSVNNGIPVILRASDKKLVNEDMDRMKKLMNYKSYETLGTLTGSERINENKEFDNVYKKTKILFETESEEETEMNETEMEKKEEVVENSEKIMDETKKEDTKEVKKEDKKKAKKELKPIVESHGDMLSDSEVIDLANKAGNIVIDAKDSLMDALANFNGQMPLSIVIDILGEFDIDLSDLHGIEENDSFATSEFLEEINDMDDDMGDEPVMTRKDAYDASLDVEDPEDIESSLTAKSLEKEPSLTNSFNDADADYEDNDNISISNKEDNTKLQLLKNARTNQYILLVRNGKRIIDDITVPDEYVELAKKHPRIAMDKIKEMKSMNSQNSFGDDDEIMEALNGLM